MSEMSDTQAVEQLKASYEQVLAEIGTSLQAAFDEVAG